MIGHKRVLGLIPARGGSKGVPRKNLHVLAGKPLLAWTVETAVSSRFIDRLILSTEDDEIARYGESIGLDVPFRRPARFASDDASAADVIRHALDAIGEPFDVFVYLEPTSPLRSTTDIDACIENVSGSEGGLAVSVQQTDSRPEWMFFLDEGGRLEPVTQRFDARPRQELRPCYVLNGAVYAARVGAFERTGTFMTEGTFAHVMPPERSVDIDQLSDFDYAETIIRRRGGTTAPSGS